MLDRRERHGEEGGEAHVVEADNSKVLRHLEIETCEGLQELGGGVVVGADDGVVLATCGEFADELHVAGISSMKEVSLDGEAVRQHRGSGSGFAGIDGGGGEGARDEGETSGSEFDQVIGEQITASEVVDAREIKAAALRKGAYIAINKHHGDACVAEALGNAAVGGFVVGGVLEGREDHTTDASLDVARAEFFCLLDAHGLVGTGACAAAPVHAEVVHPREASEFAADDIKDLDLAESWHDKAKLADAGAGIAILAQVSAGASAAFQHALRFQIEQCARNRGARDFESLHQLRLARQAARMIVLAREDLGEQFAGDLLVARRILHRLIKTLQL